MSVGEHLEDLRRRLIYAILGIGGAMAFCLVYGRQVMSVFCAPLIGALRRQELNAQLYYTQVGDAFMSYLQISLISAAAIAAPWVLYQLWLFIAAGLYRHEKRLVHRFAPLSLGLLISGMAFVYFIVLPWTVEFFIEFGSDVPLPPGMGSASDVRIDDDPATRTIVPELDGDPTRPAEGQLWVNKRDGRLKIFHRGNIRTVPFGPEKLAAPMITLPDYIDLALGMLLVFGLSFQLPIVVMVLGRTGLVPVATFRSIRRYVYFALVVLACMITPGDMITASLLLLAPLALLYELGILLAVWTGRKPTSPAVD